MAKGIFSVFAKVFGARYYNEREKDSSNMRSQTLKFREWTNACFQQRNVTPHESIKNSGAKNFES